MAVSTVPASAQAPEADSEVGAAVGTVVMGVEALAAGGVELPREARVLGLRQVQGRDRLVSVAVAMQEPAVAEMLRRSGFSTPLEAGRLVYLTPVVAIAGGAEVASAQDRRAGVVREVLVEHAGARWVVHWWLYTT